MLGVDVEAERPEAADAVAEGTFEGIVDAAQAGFAESQKRVPVASGDLKESGRLVVGDVDNPFAGFEYDAEHDQPVEGGTEPHWPPIEPLKDWARLVLGDEDAAWAVQQHIAEEGTPVQEYARPGFLAMSRELQRRGIATHIEGKL